MTTDRYMTRRGIHVHRTVEAIPVKDAIEPVIEALDSRRGILLASSYEYPGRYTRWDMGFVDPPLVLVARGRGLRGSLLGGRGAWLAAWFCASTVAAATAEHLHLVGDDLGRVAILAFLVLPLACLEPTLDVDL